MANQHFELNLTKAHAKKVALMVRDAQVIVDMAQNLKALADEVTGGGVNLDNADYLSLFGLPDATAGAALYPMLQSISSGSVIQSTFVEFDQGMP